jgi:magnesium-transporting ATPase (P-type)
MKKAEAIRDMQEHKIELSVLLQKLQTSQEKGLDDATATRLLGEYGLNALTEKKGLPWYCVFA